jgi:hypothetical protein
VTADEAAVAAVTDFRPRALHEDFPEPVDPGTRIAQAPVSWLLLRYHALRDLVPAKGLADYDEAVAAITRLPLKDGYLTSPEVSATADPQHPDPEARPFPPAFPAALADRAWADVQEALDAGALRRSSPSSPRRWKRRFYHRLFAILRGDGKRIRLIADLRPTNRRSPKPTPFTLESYTAAGCAGSTVGCVLDLSNAYWSAPVHNEFADLMVTPLSEGTDAAWTVLPFGHAWSPVMFHALLHPLSVYLRALGVKMQRYLDDYLVHNKRADVCARQTKYLYYLLQWLGWQVSATKSSTTPTAVVTYLGMEVDFHEKCFRWPAKKADQVRVACLAALERRLLPRTEMEKLTGRLSFLSMCIPIARVAFRYMQRDLTGSDGQTVSLRSADTREELRFWADRAASFSDRPYAFASLTYRTRWVVSTDASDFAGGIVIRHPDGTREAYTVLLPPDLTAASSAARELWTTTTALWQVGRSIMGPAVVDVYTDSQTSVAALHGGAKAENLVRLCRSVLAFQESFGVLVRPAWLPRDELAYEDALSRSAPLTEAGLTPACLRYLFDWGFGGAKPELDLFASPANHVVPRWVAPVPTAGAWDTDGLRCDIPSTSWSFPPFAVARRAADRLIDRKGVHVWIGPASMGVHHGRPHVLLQGPVLLSPPGRVLHVPSPAPLVAVRFADTG